MYDSKNLLLLLATMAMLVVVIWQPLSRRFDDSDQGTDRLVKLPPFRKPSNARLVAFFLVGIGVSTVIIGMHHPQPLQVYQGTVASLVRAVDRQPATATLYAQHLTPLVPAAVVGYLVTMALVLPATLGRRLMILAHAPLFIAVSALSDTFVGLAEVAFHIPPAIVPVLTVYLEYLLGFMMVFRLIFTTYALPRVTRQPIGRRGDWRDTVEMLLVIAASTGIVFPFALWLISRVGDHPVIEFIILVSLRTAISDFIYVLLGLCKWAGGRRPQPGNEHPAVDIIIPAYNEEYGIERLLRSIDAAAGRYGGPVHVWLCDDGSTDATSELANATMRAFSYATGDVILGAHGGKAKALNQALGRCTAEFVFRLDADCAVDRDCFRYAIPYFLSDPRVGLVGALTVPKEPYYTWIDRMRCMEQVFNFGFSQVMLTEVDAVPCVLGSFMGFRRQGPRRLRQRHVRRGRRVHLRPRPTRLARRPRPAHRLLRGRPAEPARPARAAVSLEHGRNDELRKVHPLGQRRSGPALLVPVAEECGNEVLLARALLHDGPGPAVRGHRARRHAQHPAAGLAGARLLPTGDGAKSLDADVLPQTQGAAVGAAVDRVLDVQAGLPAGGGIGLRSTAGASTSRVARPGSSVGTRAVSRADRAARALTSGYSTRIWVPRTIASARRSASSVSGSAV